MYSYNRVHLIGYQTQPVDLRTTPQGSSVTDLNLVVPYTFTAENGDTVPGKGFHVVTVWGGMANAAAQFVKPGSQLFIAGRLQTDSWEDQSTGEKRSKTKIVALDMTMLDPKDGQLAAPAGTKHIAHCVNRVDIVGNATREPEMRTTGTGQQVVSFSVATNDSWMDKSTNERRERTEFHNIVVWGDLAQEVSQFIKKGSRVYVSGRVQTRSWETQDGNKRYTTEVVAETVHLLGIANAAVLDSISASATPMPAQAAAPAPAAQSTESAAPTAAVVSENEDPFADGAPAAASDPAAEPVAANIPEVQYSSEVKVEDLPF